MDNKELEFELLTDKEDKRNKLITLTPKGKAYASEIIEALQEMSGLYGIQMIYFSSKMDAYGVWSAEKIWHSFFCRHSCYGKENTDSRYWKLNN